MSGNARLSSEFALLPTLRQLRAFEAVARLKSVNAAAAEIRVSQPAVWQAVTKLERMFDTRLFDRRSTGTYLNRPGDVLLERTKRFFAQFQDAFANVAQPRPDPARLNGLLLRITTAQLRILLAMAEAGTGEEAAARLGISEAALRRGARALEQTVGKTLFFRSAAGNVLSPDGAELSRRLQVAIVEIRHAIDDLRAVEGSVTGQVVVGSLPLARTLFLPRAVNALLDLYPDASVEIVEGSYASLLGQLRKGSADLIVGALRTKAVPEDIVEETLFFDPFAIVLRKDHPLTRVACVTLEHLAAFDWVVPRNGTPIRATFDALFSGSCAAPRANIEASSLSAIRALLAESDRLTILSRRQIAIDEELGLLSTLEYPMPVASRPIGIATRASWMPALVQREFVRLLREQAANFEAADTDSLHFQAPVTAPHDIVPAL